MFSGRFGWSPAGSTWGQPIFYIIDPQTQNLSDVSLKNLPEI